MWITVPHALPNIAPIYRPSNRVHDRKLGHLRRYESHELISAGRSCGLTAVDVQFTGHSIKVLQLALANTLPMRIGERFWWLCERRDLRRTGVRRGAMQLSALFRRDT